MEQIKSQWVSSGYWMHIYAYMRFFGTFCWFFSGCFYHFNFFFWWSIKINHSETGIGSKKLSVELYGDINLLLPLQSKCYFLNIMSKIIHIFACTFENHLIMNKWLQYGTYSSRLNRLFITSIVLLTSLRPRHNLRVKIFV